MYDFVDIMVGVFVAAIVIAILVFTGIGLCHFVSQAKSEMHCAAIQNSQCVICTDGVSEEVKCSQIQINNKNGE